MLHTVATTMSMEMATMAALAMATGIKIVIQVDLEETVMVTGSEHSLLFSKWHILTLLLSTGNY